jgi:YesN/AraC family two-component response regulator
MTNKRVFSVFIAEDEYPARKLLTDFIANRPELKLNGIAKNGKEALQMLASHSSSEEPVYDLLLFDIHLPIISGIEVLEKIEKIPYIIFITAYSQYALRAFEIGAIDFILKPFEFKRFNQAIDKFLVFIKYNVPYDVYRGIEELKGPEKYKNSKLTKSDAHKYSKQLTQLITKDKIFQDPDITLRKLASVLSVSPHHISQVINQELNMNYYEFINSYRIEEAKKVLSIPANKYKTIIDLLFDVGFKSKSVFNSVFKEYTGMTPTEFRRKNKP